MNPPPGGKGTLQTDQHYTIITADSHGGGSHAAYRECLDSKYLEAFDAWRGRYRNPFRDLGDQRRLRNWDNDMRNSQQQDDGVVGEVIFPNTVPPFFPSFVLFAPPPSPADYELRLAGIRAHNRWLADFCAEFPTRRAGIGQILLNEVDEALADVRWIHDHGLRGGVLLPPIPPDAGDYIRPFNHPDYDAVWRLCEELGVPLNCHGGVGSPGYPPLPGSKLLHQAELLFYSRRPLVWLILSGVFERFPGLKFVVTEQGCTWLAPLLRQLDNLVSSALRGDVGELRFTADEVPVKRLPSEYVRTNVWLGASQPTPADLAARFLVEPGHFMWGSDYPHDEGTYPFTREHLRQVFAGVPEVELRDIIGGNAAALYGFDLKALAPLADQYGPTVAEIRRPLTELPPNPNQALIKGQITSEMALV